MSKKLYSISLAFGTTALGVGVGLLSTPTAGAIVMAVAFGGVLLSNGFYPKNPEKFSEVSYYAGMALSFAAALGCASIVDRITENTEKPQKQVSMNYNQR